MATKVKYELDLVSAFNNAFPSQRLRNKLRPLISDPQVKRSIGRAVVNKIKSNTEKQKDRHGELFVGAPGESGRKYSQSYIDSLAFKVHVKSPTIINLTLTSTMLNSMLASSQPGKVVVTMTPDQNDKAHGHINGTRSKKGKKGLPKRDFLGLPEDEESQIVKKIVNQASSSRVGLAIEDIASIVSAGQTESVLSSAATIATQASDETTFLTLLAEGLDENGIP